MILLVFFFPLAVYLLLLGFLNRHRHPLLVSGVWDGIGLIFGVSGFLLFAGPAVLSTVSDRWRWFWLLGRGDVSLATAEGAWPMWLFLALQYSLLVVGGAALYLWRQRRLTAIYNTNAETVEQAVTGICKELGINLTRSGALFLFAASSSSSLSHDRKEAISTSLPEDRCSDFASGQPIILEVDSFPLMHHVTLRWEPAASPLRRSVEAELRRRLAETVSDDGLLGGWLLALGFVLFSFSSAGALSLILLNLHAFLR